MSSKLNTYSINVVTNSGSNHQCLIPALNYMDAVSKFSTQGFAVTMQGRIILTSSVSDFSIEKTDDTTSQYLEFAKNNEELLKGLRIM